MSNTLPIVLGALAAVIALIGAAALANIAMKKDAHTPTLPR
jgi:hypothetical protein